MSDQPRPVFRLTIRDQGGDVPAEHRLAHVLKRLLRVYGFACIRLEQLQTIWAEAETADTHPREKYL